MPSPPDQPRRLRLRLPLAAGDVQGLRAGDLVYLDGLVITGREGVYRKLLDGDAELPPDVLARCNVQIHCAPSARRTPSGEYVVSAVQATASFRYHGLVPGFLARYGFRAIIGKGGMDPRLYREHFRPHGCVFLLTLGYGLLSARYARAVRSVRQVLWAEELGLPEALWVLEVEDFGPFLVDFDLAGACLMEQAGSTLEPRLTELLAGLPEPWMARQGEAAVPGDDITCAQTVVDTH